MKTILFSGVHGVGKGYFLKQVCIDKEGYRIISASDLIKRYRNATDAGYKKVSNVKENQEILLTALNEEQEKKQSDIVLDGHLCIINAQDEVERIPEYFFERGSIDGIILLQDEARTISDRLKNRDDQQLTPASINKIQEEERGFAKYLKTTYGIEYEIINHQCGKESFKEIIKRIGEHANE